MSIRPGPQPQHPEISDREREAFRALIRDGAWTGQEAMRAFSEARLAELSESDFLAVTWTAMGTLIFPKAKARVVATGSSDKPRSYATSVNTTYQRLALKRLGWTVVTDPQRRPPTVRKDLTVVETQEGIVMLSAQFGSGKGCSVEKLQNLVQQWRSEALFHNIKWSYCCQTFVVGVAYRSGKVPG